MSKKSRLMIIIATASVIIISIIGLVLGLTLGGGNKDKNTSYRNIKIAELDGECEVIRGDKTLEGYQEMALRSEDLINTKASSSVILKLDNDKLIRLFESSSLRLISSERDKSRAVLNLIKGKEIIEIKNKLNEGELFEVDSMTSSMAIRGTIIALERFKRGELEVSKYSLLEGAASLKSFYPKDDNIIMDEASLLPGMSLEISLKGDIDKLSDKLDEYKEMDYNNDPRLIKNEYDSILSLISKSENVGYNNDKLSDELMDEIIDSLNKFKEMKYRVVAINSFFNVLDESGNAYINNQVSYESDKPFKIKAFINPNLVLTSWYINGEKINEANNEIEIEVDKELTIEARLKKQSLSLEGCMLNGKTGALMVNSGETINIDLLEGEIIDRWIINGKEEIPYGNSLSLKSDKDYTIKAITIKDKPNETLVELSGLSFVRPATEGNRLFIDKNSDFLVSGIKKPGYRIDYFLVNNERYENTNNSLLLVANDRLYIEAIYKEIPKYEVKLIDCDCLAKEIDLTKLEEGSHLTIRARLKPGMNVKGWEINDKPLADSSDTIELIVDSNMTIKPIFGEASYKLTVHTAEGLRVILDDKPITSDTIIPGKPNEVHRVAIEVLADYVYEGCWNKEYGASNRRLINNLDRFEVALDRDIEIYPSALRARNNLTLVDEEGYMFFSGGSEGVLFDVMAEANPKLRVDRLSLYRGSEKNKFEKMDPSQYEMEIYANYLIFDANNLEGNPEYVDELNPNLPGAYMIKVFSKNRDNPLVNGLLAEFDFMISPYVEVPEKIASIDIAGEKMDLIPANSYGLITGIINSNLYTIKTKSSCYSFKSIDRESNLYILNGLFNEEILKDPSAIDPVVKNFKIDIDDHFNIYVYDYKTDTIKLFTGGEVEFKNGSLELLVIPKFANQETGEDVFKIPRAFSVNLTLAKGDLNVTFGENKLGDKITNQLIINKNGNEGNTEINHSINNPLDLTSVMAINGLDFVNHNSDGSLNIHIKSSLPEEMVKISTRDGEIIPSNGEYSFKLKPVNKYTESLPLELPLRLEGFNINFYWLTYRFEVKFGNEGYSVILGYYVVQPEIRDDVISFISGSFGEAYGRRNVTKSKEEMGYDEAIWKKFFTPEGDGYDLGANPDTL